MKNYSVLPGFHLNLGFCLIYLSLIVLIPLSALVLKASAMNLAEFWSIISEPRLVASYRLSLSLALAAAAINTVFGGLLAWVLVRYPFPGRAWVDALIDLPFALPTAVAGLALTALYSADGWIGRWFDALGLPIAFTPRGILIALIFVGLPLLVRSVQPALAALDRSLEEAAASLGASPWQRMRLLILPLVTPSLLTGFALAFARGLGEYGSVIFIAGNIPFLSEITPLLIVSKLEQYDDQGATAIALVMLSFSFLLLFTIQALQSWSQRFRREEVRS